MMMRVAWREARRPNGDGSGDDYSDEILMV
jgi:hypothetical protein